MLPQQTPVTARTTTSSTSPSLLAACRMGSVAVPFVTQASESSKEEEEPILPAEP